MVTGSPSSPLVAKILVQWEAEANIEQSRSIYSQWGPGSGYEIPIYYHIPIRSLNRNKNPKKKFHGNINRILKLTPSILSNDPFPPKWCPNNSHHTKSGLPHPISHPIIPTCNNRLVPSPNQHPYRKRYSHLSAPTANQWHPLDRCLERFDSLRWPWHYCLEVESKT